MRVQPPTHPRSFCKKHRYLSFLLCLGSILLCSHVNAYNISYSYQMLSTAELENPVPTQDAPLVSKHQIVITDGYCVFVHNGPFNRLCFEAGPGLRFDRFAFDLHAQITFHSIWLRPFIYGLFINAGPFVTLYPNFHMGLRISTGFHLYFVAPAIEFQVTIDEFGRGDARFFLQLTLHIPTGSANFVIGNAGL